MTGELREKVAQIIEASLVRHGVDVYDCDGTIDDAQDILDIPEIREALAAMDHLGRSEWMERCGRQPTAPDTPSR